MDLKKKTLKYLKQKTWFHGTSVSGYESIKKQGIKALFNINHELDFGAGFYLAPEKDMAASFVKRILEFKSLVIPNIVTDEITPIVLEIEFVISPHDYFLDESYNTGVYEKFNEDFAKFVFHNRTSNVGVTPDHGYDLIYGVMSDSNPTKLITLFNAGEISEDEVVKGIMEGTNSTKQLSIHNQGICGILTIKDVHPVEQKEVESV